MCALQLLTSSPAWKKRTYESAQRGIPAKHSQGQWVQGGLSVFLDASERIPRDDDALRAEHEAEALGVTQALSEIHEFIHAYVADVEWRVIELYGRNRQFISLDEFEEIDALQHLTQHLGRLHDVWKRVATSHDNLRSEQRLTLVVRRPMTLTMALESKGMAKLKQEAQRWKSNHPWHTDTEMSCSPCTARFNAPTWGDQLVLACHRLVFVDLWDSLHENDGSQRDAIKNERLTESIAD